MKARHAVTIAVLGILPLQHCGADQPVRDCEEIEINSAGKYCFDPARVLGVAPGSGGRHGVANYLRISSPVHSNASFSEVSKIILMADLHSSKDPKCEKRQDDGYTCAASVLGKGLKVIVSFQPAVSENLEELTSIVARDVAENVIR